MKRKLPLLIWTAVLLCSCGQSGALDKVSATGSIYECLVVMDNKPLTQEQLNGLSQAYLYGNGSAYDEPIATTYDLIRATLGAVMPCMPQAEDCFRLTQVNKSAFDDFLKPTRNILIVDIDPQRYTSVKEKRQRDVWSHPQAVVRLQCPSQEALVDYWQQQGNNIREWFINQEIKRQITFLRGYTNHEARERLQQMLGCDMLIPEEYQLILDTVNTSLDSLGIQAVLWCCNNQGPMRRDLVVYTYPYTDRETFTPEYLNRRRDEVMQRLVSASLDGSYMGTEYRVFPPEMRIINPLDGSNGLFYAAEVRGLWKIYHGESMGGPYVSHTRLDEMHHRVITAEAFLLAPGQKKRTAIRQMEAILYTLELPEEVNQLQEVEVH